MRLCAPAGERCSVGARGLDAIPSVGLRRVQRGVSARQRGIDAVLPGPHLRIAGGKGEGHRCPHRGDLRAQPLFHPLLKEAQRVVMAGALFQPQP